MDVMRDPGDMKGRAEEGEMQARTGTSESESHGAKKRRGGQDPESDANVSETCVGCCVQRRRCGEQSASRDGVRERRGEGRRTAGGGRRSSSQKRGYNTQRGRE